jgi:hypothetical protein
MVLERERYSYTRIHTALSSTEEEGARKRSNFSAMWDYELDFGLVRG